MIARSQIFLARLDSQITELVDTHAVSQALTSKRAQYILAQAVMVTGYLSAIFNPFDPDAMLLGLICEATAIALYVSSKNVG